MIITRSLLSLLHPILLSNINGINTAAAGSQTICWRPLDEGSKPCLMKIARKDGTSKTAGSL
jgi:hypothetical protein